jgi:hypothetical protein
MEQPMKHKIKHNKNNEQTAVWLTKTIDRELACGEEADEQLILECTAYLQEIFPENAPSDKRTEKYLQAELSRPQAVQTAIRKPIRRGLRLAMRLAAVVTALALFCVALPVMAAQVLGEKSTATDTSDLLKPILQLLSNETEPTALSYPTAGDFEKEPTYRASYSSVQKLLTEEQPPDVICLTDLPKELDRYQINLVYYGEKKSADKWRIHWSANDESWGYLISYRNTSGSVELTKEFYTQKGYELCEANGRRYFYKMTESGTYTAKYIQGPILYSATAPDYETLMLLLSHTAFASEIIPATAQQITLRSPEEYTELHSLIKNPSLLGYRASYESTSEFVNFEKLNILTVDDSAAQLGDHSITVFTNDSSYHWMIEWKATNIQQVSDFKGWTFRATYHLNNQEIKAKYAEQAPQKCENYTVGEHTFYISNISPRDHEIIFLDHAIFANCYEGNICYSVSASDRETLELLLNSLIFPQGE